METSENFINYKFHESSKFNSILLKENKVYMILFVSTVNTTPALLLPYVSIDWRSNAVIYPKYEPISIIINKTGFWLYGDFSTVKNIKVFEISIH